MRSGTALAQPSRTSHRVLKPQIGFDEQGTAPFEPLWRPVPTAMSPDVLRLAGMKLLENHVALLIARAVAPVLSGTQWTNVLIYRPWRRSALDEALGRLDRLRPGRTGVFGTIVAGIR